MTKMIELPDDLAAQLEREAKQLKMEPEKWAILKLQRSPQDGDRTGVISDADWESINHGVINDNRNLLERLAK